MGHIPQNGGAEDLKRPFQIRFRVAGVGLWCRNSQTTRQEPIMKMNAGTSRISQCRRGTRFACRVWSRLVRAVLYGCLPRLQCACGCSCIRF
jgi:hypothetical protein